MEISPLAQACIKCGMARRKDGSMVPPSNGVGCGPASHFIEFMPRPANPQYIPRAGSYVSLGSAKKAAEAFAHIRPNSEPLKGPSMHPSHTDAAKVANYWKVEGPVSWGVVNGVFWKITAGSKDATEERFARLNLVYEKYAAICDAPADTLPPQLCRAELFFRQKEVAVRMDPLPGGHITEDRIERDPLVIQGIASTIVFLAQRGLIYTDLNVRNVMVYKDQFWLIDYDDMVVCNNCSTFQEFELVLSSAQNTYEQHPTYMSAIRTMYSMMTAKDVEQEEIDLDI